MIMGITTRAQMKAEVENFKNLVFERLEGRDIQKAVDELYQKTEDVIIDEIGMPLGWETDNDDHQAMFFDMVAEQLIKAYFSGKEQA